MVLGQSREEFDIYMSSFGATVANNCVKGKNNTAISLFIHGKKLRAPKFQLPYFPIAHGEELDELIQGTGEAISTCPIVHETCALHMLRARLDRSRYTPQLSFFRLLYACLTDILLSSITSSSSSSFLLLLFVFFFSSSSLLIFFFDSLLSDCGISLSPILFGCTDTQYDAAEN